LRTMSPHSWIWTSDRVMLNSVHTGSFFQCWPDFFEIEWYWVIFLCMEIVNLQIAIASWRVATNGFVRPI
jgi:hypothetical protein